VNVDRRWWGVSVVRIRMAGAGLALLAAAWIVLGTASRIPPLGALSANSPANLTAPSFGPRPDATADASTLARSRSIFSGLPIMFEPNRGQANLDPNDPRARYVARGADYSLFFGAEGATVSFRAQPADGSSSAFESFQMKLAGANPRTRLTPANPLPGKTNYLLGSDPSRWQVGIPQFARVRYENLYPGIDLAFYGNQGRLEYDFQLAPGANPEQAELEFSTARQLEIRDGDLLIPGRNGSARLSAPRAYQEIDGRRQPVEAAFVVRGGHRAGFVLGPYDHSHELVIDPALNFSTYFGGSGDERATSIAVDAAGNFYLTGSTTSSNLPITAGVYQASLKATPPNTNVYLVKINPVLNPPVEEYVTYLGGTGSDTPVGIAVDGGGDAFVVGTTSSVDFPHTSNAYQTVPEAGSAGTLHAFAAELDPLAATLKYSTYLSGNGNDAASGMAIDAAGDVFVTGTTTSSDTPSLHDQFPASTIPNALAYQSAPRAPLQFFVTKINTAVPQTGSIAYSTYFGGANFNTPTPVNPLCPANVVCPIATGGGIAVDSVGNIYFAGTTNFTYTGCSGCGNTDFPILNAYQPCLDQAPIGAITNPITCTNTSPDSDAFVAKLNPNAAQGQQLVWSTYLGGLQTDSGTGVALDPGAANVYLTGTTNSGDFVLPTTTGAFQTCLNNPVVPTGGCPTQGAGAPTDAFVARFPNLTPTTVSTNLSLAYFSYLGGSGNEAGLSIVADSGNGGLVTGWTQSTNFPVFPAPTTGCFLQCNLDGAQDAFVARLNTVATTGTNTASSWATYFGGSNLDEGTSIALDVNQNTYIAGDTNSTNLQVTGLQTQNAGGYDAFATQLRSAANITISGLPTLGTNQAYFWAGVPAQFTYTITNVGSDLATGLTLVDNLAAALPVVLTSPSGSASGGACSGTTTATSLTCPIGSLQAGATATVTISVTPTATGGSAAFNGGNVQVFGPNNIQLTETTVYANMSDFGMTVNPPNNSVAQAGNSVSYYVQLTPHPVYGASVALSCSGQPSATTCTFSPTSVTLQGSSPATATLTVGTTARPITSASVRSTFGRSLAVWLALPGLALIGLGAAGKRNRRSILGWMLLYLLLIQLLPLPGCSSSSTPTPTSGTPPGTWPITITATSGSNAKSQGIQLTVP